MILAILATTVIAAGCIHPAPKSGTNIPVCDVDRVVKVGPVTSVGQTGGITAGAVGSVTCDKYVCAVVQLPECVEGGQSEPCAVSYPGNNRVIPAKPLSVNGVLKWCVGPDDNLPEMWVCGSAPGDRFLRLKRPPCGTPEADKAPSCLRWEIEGTGGNRQ